MSREEAAAMAMVDVSVKWQTSDAGELAKAALAAADAHDAAHGIHRVNLDDATVERAAAKSWDALAERDGGRPWAELAHENGLKRMWASNVRIVLAAAVEAGQ